jgi:hypothetical protein
MDQQSDPDAIAADGNVKAEASAHDELRHDGQAPAGPAPASAAAPPGQWSRSDLLGIAIAAVGGAAIVLTMLVPRAGSREPGVVAAAPPARTLLPQAASSPAGLSTPAPPVATARWRAADEWVGSRRRSVAFELAAASPVRVWMRQVTPTLVVRCLGGSLDAFVVTQSPSTIEPGRSDHTVRLVFDGQERVEHWADSAEHDGLFAPDGGAFLARLSKARTLTVGFTPHNAPATEASFAVSGAADLVGPLKRHCR